MCIGQREERTLPFIQPKALCAGLIRAVGGQRLFRIPTQARKKRTLSELVWLLHREGLISVAMRSLGLSGTRVTPSEDSSEGSSDTFPCQNTNQRPQLSPSPRRGHTRFLSQLWDLRKLPYLSTLSFLLGQMQITRPSSEEYCGDWRQVASRSAHVRHTSQS